jgi:pyruvate dehydrogenase E2 component (dihydrolipoamide acetyltransferase)
MYEFALPSLGSDMDQAKFVEWNVKPGQSVKRGDIVCVVESEKGAIDVEIWTEGTIAKLLAKPDQALAVGQTIAILSLPGEDLTKVMAEESGPQTVVAPRPRISPAARRMAAEKGINLADLRSASPDGVVTLANLQDAQAKAPPRNIPATVPIHPPFVERSVDTKTSMRSVISAAMARSKREIPHYYLSTEVNVEEALRLMEAFNATRPIAQRILFIALLLKAVAKALQEAPELNGFMVNGIFQPATSINIGIVTSLRGGGLVVPALHHVDQLQPSELMVQLHELLSRARSGKLRSSDLADGTISLTSMGDLGVDSIFGVIYPPQVAIVGLGRVIAKPVAKGRDTIVARTLQATLSADHRVTDGLMGARFLQCFKNQLEQPEAL